MWTGTRKRASARQRTSADARGGVSTSVRDVGSRASARERTSASD